MGDGYQRDPILGRYERGADGVYGRYGHRVPNVGDCRFMNSPRRLLIIGRRFKGFLQVYQLQTENDEEETWRDLVRDNKLMSYVGPTPDRVCCSQNTGLTGT